MHHASIATQYGLIKVTCSFLFKVSRTRRSVSSQQYLIYVNLRALITTIGCLVQHQSLSTCNLFNESTHCLMYFCCGSSLSLQCILPVVLYFPCSRQAWIQSVLNPLNYRKLSQNQYCLMRMNNLPKQSSSFKTVIREHLYFLVFSLALLSKTYQSKQKFLLRVFTTQFRSAKMNLLFYFDPRYAQKLR